MARLFLSRGFKKVFALKGGWRAWEDAQYPIEQKESERPALVEACVKCHLQVTPSVVAEWEASRHSQNEVSCLLCHGVEHMSAEDVAKSVPVTQDLCAMCHEAQAVQFRAGKHAVAWEAAKAIPRAHWQSMSLVEGSRGCASCHKVGLKTQAEIHALKKAGIGQGVASCDNCHSRHSFSLKEAGQPQACQPCHQGTDHNQWEMYAGSKHGIRHLLKQNRALPEATPAPTCQTCHMPERNHEVRTAWGFWALRLPMPEDPTWADASTKILRALGMLDQQGNPTGMFEAARSVDLLRLSREDWQRERDRMVQVCGRCHAADTAREELARGDRVVRQADLLAAEAIRIVSDLYRYESAREAGSPGHLFPGLLTFHEGQRPIEQRLFSLFQIGRSRAFKGRFHGNLEEAFQRGLGQMIEDLTAIRAMSGQSPVIPAR